jgi:hypothetical protein
MGVPLNSARTFNAFSDRGTLTIGASVDITMLDLGRAHSSSRTTVKAYGPVSSGCFRSLPWSRRRKGRTGCDKHPIWDAFLTGVQSQTAEQTLSFRTKNPATGEEVKEFPLQSEEIFVALRSATR